jgi:hypothetical protein
METPASSPDKNQLKTTVRDGLLDVIQDVKEYFSSIDQTNGFFPCLV